MSGAAPGENQGKTISRCRQRAPEPTSERASCAARGIRRRQRWKMRGASIRPVIWSSARSARSFSGTARIEVGPLGPRVPPCARGTLDRGNVHERCTFHAEPAAVEVTPLDRRPRSWPEPDPGREDDERPARVTDPGRDLVDGVGTGGEHVVAVEGEREAASPRKRLVEPGRRGRDDRPRRRSSGSRTPGRVAGPARTTPSSGSSRPPGVCRATRRPDQERLLDLPAREVILGPAQVARAGGVRRLQDGRRSLFRDLRGSQIAALAWHAAGLPCWRAGPSGRGSQGRERSETARNPAGTRSPICG